MKKKTTNARADDGLLPFGVGNRADLLLERGEFTKGARKGFVEDPRTGRKWEWCEEDMPGLADFLGSLLSNSYPLAHVGKKFKPKGRGMGPIRKAIARLLKRNPGMKNAALWEALSANPPRDWEIRDNNLGKYIEGPKAANMNYARFCNVAAEERANRKR